MILLGVTELVAHYALAVLSRLDECREFVECHPPAGFVVGKQRRETQNLRCMQGDESLLWSTEVQRLGGGIIKIGDYCKEQVYYKPICR
jgi:hypothetical protein